MSIAGGPIITLVPVTGAPSGLVGATTTRSCSPLTIRPRGSGGCLPTVATDDRDEARRGAARARSWVPVVMPGAHTCCSPSRRRAGRNAQVAVVDLTTGPTSDARTGRQPGRVHGWPAARIRVVAHLRGGWDASAVRFDPRGSPCSGTR